ncbi:hypothetical protein ACFFIH_27105, partial [Rhizorhabdus histidinilytica]
HGHAQPPFRSSRLIGAERQPTSDCRQSLQQSRKPNYAKPHDQHHDRQFAELDAHNRSEYGPCFEQIKDKRGDDS